MGATMGYDQFPTRTMKTIFADNLPRVVTEEMAAMAVVMAVVMVR